MNTMSRNTKPQLSAFAKIQVIAEQRRRLPTVDNHGWFCVVVLLSKIGFPHSSLMEVADRAPQTLSTIS